MVAESVRQPRMAELFYAAGPERLVAHLAEYLREVALRGELEFEDPQAAAEQFLSLVKGRIQYRALLNLRPRTSKAEAGLQVDAAVRTFLRAFAPR
jgi:TetR/AcrR family transcriptional repressor of mexJK operon